MICGMIHGRFQPFTIGHMEYLKYVLAQVEKLVIGITNPELIKIEQNNNDDHRHLQEANPYSYFERYCMIEESIKLDLKLQHRLSDIIIIPLYLDNITTWSAFLPPLEFVQYINLYDDWDKEKKRRFEHYGYKTVDIALPRLTSATEVRRLIKINDTSWYKLVPLGTRNIIEQIGV